jgi:hypothetical protein
LRSLYELGLAVLVEGALPATTLEALAVAGIVPLTEVNSLDAETGEQDGR